MLGFSYQYIMASDEKASLSTTLPELPEGIAWYRAAGWDTLTVPEPVKLRELERAAVRLSSLSRLVAAVHVETRTMSTS